jgi:hypothetical protein
MWINYEYPRQKLKYLSVWRKLQEAFIQEFQNLNVNMMKEENYLNYSLIKIEPSEMKEWYQLGNYLMYADELFYLKYNFAMSIKFLEHSELNIPEVLLMHISLLVVILDWRPFMSHLWPNWRSGSQEEKSDTISQ